MLTGGRQSDTFVYQAAHDSIGAGYDTITNLAFGSDKIWLDAGTLLTGDTQPTGIDAAITHGALSTATFTSDLAAAVNASNLAANHAVLFTADSGTLSGHTFLIVADGGGAGYQSAYDYVIDVTGYTGTLTTADFI